MRTRFVGIDGPGGAGKSTFAALLATAFGDCPILHTDDFASWSNPIDWWPEMLARALVPLSRGEPAVFRPSSWETEDEKQLMLMEVAPTPVIIVEGVTALRRAFRPYLAYAIWIDVSHDTRLERGVARDGEAARNQWERWIAGEDEYRARERPDEYADLVISGETDLWT